MSDDDSCPLCCEALDMTDKRTQLCDCGYKICLWCWNQIMDNASRDLIDPRCPNCRSMYSRANVKMVELDDAENLQEDVKKRDAKKKSTLPIKKAELMDLRVVQRNLVYVVGLPTRLCHDEVLKGPDYFGQYGRIKKISVNKNSAYSASRQTQSGAAYIVYHTDEDALKCIEGVDGDSWGGKQIRACFGTTKYCNAFLKNMPCNNPDCLYLHALSAGIDNLGKDDSYPANGTRKGYPDVSHSGGTPTPTSTPPPATDKSEPARRTTQQPMTRSSTLPTLPTTGPAIPRTERGDRPSTTTRSGTMAPTWGSVSASTSTNLAPVWGLPRTDSQNLSTSDMAPSTSSANPTSTLAPGNWPSLGDDTRQDSVGRIPELSTLWDADTPDKPSDTSLGKKPSVADIVAGNAPPPPANDSATRAKSMVPLVSSGKPRSVTKSPQPQDLISSVLLPNQQPIASPSSPSAPPDTHVPHPDHTSAAPDATTAAFRDEDGSASGDPPTAPDSDDHAPTQHATDLQSAFVDNDDASDAPFVGTTTSLPPPLGIMLPEGTHSNAFQLFGPTLFPAQDLLSGLQMPANPSPPLGFPTPQTSNASQGRLPPPPGFERIPSQDVRVEAPSASASRQLIPPGGLTGPPGFSKPNPNPFPSPPAAMRGSNIWSDQASFDKMLVDVAGILTEGASQGGSQGDAGASETRRSRFNFANDDDTSRASFVSDSNSFHSSKPALNGQQMNNQTQHPSLEQASYSSLLSPCFDAPPIRTSSAYSQQSLGSSTWVTSPPHPSHMHAQQLQQQQQRAPPPRGDVRSPSLAQQAHHHDMLKQLASSQQQQINYGSVPPPQQQQHHHPQKLTNRNANVGQSVFLPFVPDNQGMMLLHELRNRQGAMRSATIQPPPHQQPPQRTHIPNSAAANAKNLHLLQSLLVNRPNGATPPPPGSSQDASMYYGMSTNNVPLVDMATLRRQHQQQQQQAAHHRAGSAPLGAYSSINSYGSEVSGMGSRMSGPPHEQSMPNANQALSSQAVSSVDQLQLMAALQFVRQQSAETQHMLALHQRSNSLHHTKQLQHHMQPPSMTADLQRLLHSQISASSGMQQALQHPAPPPTSQGPQQMFRRPPPTATWNDEMYQRM